MTPYIYQRGETISLALDAVTGDPAQVTTISAAMKPVPPGRSEAPAAAPFAASFLVAPRAAAGGNPPGWTLTIPALVSASLSPGAYVADARLEVAGGVIVTETVAIRLKQSVSA
ncbi:MAG: hypothetical protein ACRCY3_07020 [Sphingorhabdus sp.]